MAEEAWVEALKFNIISINDERIAYKDNIRKHVGMEEVSIPSVNAYKVDLPFELKSRGLESRPWTPKIGELGVWLSNFDCWQWAADNEELVVFEDDAIIDENFYDGLQVLYSELPEDWDFLTLWVPENQRQDYMYRVEYDDEGMPNILGNVPPGKSSFDYGARFTARAYQGYGLVATMYSPKGGAALIESARRRGICTPADCFIFQETHAERVKGYAPKPTVGLVSYDWSAETTVHNTGIYSAV